MSRSEPSSGQTAGGPIAASGRPPLLLLAALLLALSVPRLLVYGDLESTHHLRFMDMLYHLSNMDRMHKNAALPPEQSEDPYLRRFPGARDLLRASQWSGASYRLGLLFLPRFGPRSILTVQLPNLLATVVLALGVVALGVVFLGSMRAGLWGAILTLLCPALFAHNWYFSLDYHLAAVVVWALVLLHRTQGLSRPLPTLAFALVSALGLWVKLSFALYLAAPAGVALVQGLRRGPRVRVAAQALGGAGIAAGLSFLLLGWQPAEVAQLFLSHLSGPAWEAGDTFRLLEPYTARWLAAMAIFAAASFPWPLLLLALPGFVLLHTRRAPEGRALLLAFLWGTYVVLTLMANKMERYLHPAYPVLCLLCVCWVRAWIPSKMRQAVLGLQAAAFAGVLALTQLHPTPWRIDERSVRDDAYMLELAMPGAQVRENLRRFGHPSCDLGPVEQAMQGLVRRHAGKRPVGVAVRWPHDEGPRHMGLSSYDLYLVAMQLLPDRFVAFQDGMPEDRLPPDVLQAPSLVVLHSPSQDLTAAHPELRAAESVPLRVTCDLGEPWVVAARLTLFHPTRDEPPPDPRDPHAGRR